MRRDDLGSRAQFPRGTAVWSGCFVAKLFLRWLGVGFATFGVIAPPTNSGTSASLAPILMPGSLIFAETSHSRGYRHCSETEGIKTPQLDPSEIPHCFPWIRSDGAIFCRTISRARCCGACGDPPLRRRAVVVPRDQLGRWLPGCARRRRWDIW